MDCRGQGGLSEDVGGVKGDTFKRLMAQYPFLCDYRRVWELDLAQDAYMGLSKYFRLFDPQHLREDEIYTRLGYIDVQHLAGRIRGEVFFITGLMDTVCPPSTQFAAYNKIKAPKRMRFIPIFVMAKDIREPVIRLLSL